MPIDANLIIQIGKLRPRGEQGPIWSTLGLGLGKWKKSQGSHGPRPSLAPGASRIVSWVQPGSGYQRREHACACVCVTA